MPARFPRTRPGSSPAPPIVEEELEPAERVGLVNDPEWTELAVSVDVSGIDLADVNISRCRFTGATLRGADLSRARIADAVFTDCDVSGVALEGAVVTRAEFRNCRLSGLVFNGSTLRDVRITDCKADGLGLRATRVERLVIERTVLRGADFASSRLAATRLFDCDLNDADFNKVSLDDVKLHGSSWDRLRGMEHMRGASIAEDQVHDFAFGLLAAHRIDVTPRDDDPPTASRKE